MDKAPVEEPTLVYSDGLGKCKPRMSSLMSPNPEPIVQDDLLSSSYVECCLATLNAMYHAVMGRTCHVEDEVHFDHIS